MEHKAKCLEKCPLFPIISIIHLSYVLRNNTSDVFFHSLNLLRCELAESDPVKIH